MNKLLNSIKQKTLNMLHPVKFKSVLNNANLDLESTPDFDTGQHKKQSTTELNNYLKKAYNVNTWDELEHKYSKHNEPKFAVSGDIVRIYPNLDKCSEHLAGIECEVTNLSLDSDYNVTVILPATCQGCKNNCTVLDLSFSEYTILTDVGDK